MQNNKFLRFLCSFPMILISLFLVPIVGIILIILRPFIYRNSKKGTPIVLIVLGFLLLIPKLLIFLTELNIKVNKIPYLKQILQSKVYQKYVIRYSTYLIIGGIILLVLSSLVEWISRKIRIGLSSGVNNTVQTYIKESVKQDREVAKENDLIMKEKQEKAKHTVHVTCPYCGSENLISEKIGTCKYCRKPLENTSYTEE